jgi:hypothetical protein
MVVTVTINSTTTQMSLTVGLVALWVDVKGHEEER